MYLENQKLLNANNFNSVLISQKQFCPTASKKGKEIYAALTLTSLVDCFTVLVAYLLLATSIGSEELKITEKIALPKAIGATDSSTSLQLQVANNKYLLNGKSVELQGLSSALRSLRIQNKYESVMILADKSQSFGKLNPVVLAGLEAGYSNIKFAVQVEDDK
jgi:biopolymer transport protein ExbD